MSDSKKNHILILLGIITSVLTIGGTMMQVGDLKGQIVTTIAEHAKKLDHHDQQIDSLRGDVSDIKASIHGISSQVGKLPGKVAATIKNPPSDD